MKIKVKVTGYTSREGIREFEILKREAVEDIIDNLSFYDDVYKKTIEKAEGFTFGGNAYTFVSARDGKIYTEWLSSSSQHHPWTDFDMIILHSVKTPMEGLNENELLSDDEADKYREYIEHKEYISAEEYIEKMLGGEQELEERMENAWMYYADMQGFNWNDIKYQLDALYEKEL